MLLLSRIGAQDLKGGVNIGAWFGLGKYGTFAALEDELTIFARNRTYAFPLRTVIVRVGSLPVAESTNDLASALSADASDVGTYTSPQVAAEAAFQALLQKVDSNFCIVGSTPALDEAVGGWSEILAPYKGPEIFRTSVRDPEGAATFVQGWADKWFEGLKGAPTIVADLGIRTPVLQRATDTGVVFKFRPLGTPSARKFEDLQDGGIEFLVEKPVGSSPRLRVCRCAYGWQVVLKKNSERALLKKFQEDWSRTGPK